MEKSKRVVVTGMGIVSPIGNNKAEVKDSLYNNKSGIVFAPKYEEMGFRSQVHGKVNINFENHLEKRDLRFMGDGAAYAAIAMIEAIIDAEFATSSDSRFFFWSSLILIFFIFFLIN